MPIVPMNSFTGMPLRTWMFLNTCSAMGGPAGAVWPLIDTTLDSHSAAPTPAAVLSELRFMAIAPRPREVGLYYRPLDSLRRRLAMIRGLLLAIVAVVGFLDLSGPALAHHGDADRYVAGRHGRHRHGRRAADGEPSRPRHVRRRGRRKDRALAGRARRAAAARRSSSGGRR